MVRRISRWSMVKRFSVFTADGLTVRRGRINDDLSGLDRREHGVPRDHRDNCVLESSVIAIILNHDSRPILAAAPVVYGNCTMA